MYMVTSNMVTRMTATHSASCLYLFCNQNSKPVRIDGAGDFNWVIE